MKVGTRELKNRLSYYLRRVRQGEELDITDRGEVIAHVEPVAPPRRSEAKILRQLAEEGELTVGRGALEDFTPIRPRKKLSASRMVIEDRG